MEARRRPRPEVGCELGVSVHAVVGDLEGEGVVRAAHGDRDLRGLGVLGGVAKGLGEDGLREGLEPRRDAHGALPGDAHARVLVFEAAKDAAEGELGLALGWDEPSLERSAELAQDGLKLRVGAGAVFGGELALCAQDERQGEEALDDLLVELAGERHALVQAVGALALAGGAVDAGNERGGAAEGAQGQALTIRQLRTARRPSRRK